jgi:hypothetical protein
MRLFGATPSRIRSSTMLLLLIMDYYNAWLKCPNGHRKFRDSLRTGSTVQIEEGGGVEGIRRRHT